MRRQLLKDAGHQCTFESPMEFRVNGVLIETTPMRCSDTERLEAHHEHYKQTPENPTDGLKLVCRYHHHFLERQLRPWNANRLGRP